jgi:hypothetical protein
MGCGHLLIALVPPQTTIFIPFGVLLHPIEGFKARSRGEVSEWLKEHAWKVCIRETVSRVRIPLSPHPKPKPPLGGYLFQDEPGLPERNREINRPGTKFRHGLQMLGPPSGMSERSEDNPTHRT